MQHLVVFSRLLQCLVFFFCREFLDSTNTMQQVQNLVVLRSHIHDYRRRCSAHNASRPSIYSLFWGPVFGFIVNISTFTVNLKSST